MDKISSNFVYTSIMAKIRLGFLRNIFFTISAKSAEAGL